MQQRFQHDGGVAPSTPKLELSFPGRVQEFRQPWHFVSGEGVLTSHLLMDLLICRRRGAVSLSPVSIWQVLLGMQILCMKFKRGRRGP